MNIELQVLDWIQTLRSPLLDNLMVTITKLGNGGLIWIVLTIGLLIVPKTRKYGAILLCSLCLDIVLCNGLLKNLIGRIRPCDINNQISLLIPRPDDYSFPSGHTAASFTAVFALYFAKERKLWKPSLVLACLIAFSRMYLYVHYPTDILGGILIGLLCGCIGNKLFQTIYQKFILYK